MEADAVGAGGGDGLGDAGGAPVDEATPPAASPVDLHALISMMW